MLTTQITKLNIFPKTQPNAYVTGLNGHVTLDKDLVIGTNSGEGTPNEKKNQNQFTKGERVYWQVRWDYDPDKGPHVNVQFGGGPSIKFAFQLDTSKFEKPSQVNPNDPKQAAKVTMRKITKDVNDMVKYDEDLNKGKSGEPSWDRAGWKGQGVRELEESMEGYREWSLLIRISVEGTFVLCV